MGSGRRISAEQLLTVVRSHQSKGRVHTERGNSGPQARATCPRCNKARGLTVALGDDRLGAWTCFGCGESGGLRSLLEAYGEPTDDLTEDRASPPGATGADALVRGIRQRTFHRPAAEVVERASSRSSAFEFRSDLDVTCEANLYAESGGAVLHYLLEDRGLSPEAVRAFHLGALAVDSAPGRPPWNFLVIPVYDESGTLVNARFRPVPQSCPLCLGVGCPPPEDGRQRVCDGGTVAKAYYRCKGRPSALFGADRLTKTADRSVVVVEGELDVVSMWDLGWTTNVVSSTDGAMSGLRDEWVLLLEGYDRVLFATDNDRPGDAFAERVADQLGRYRCARVRLPHKDAGDCVRLGVEQQEVLRALESAESMMPVRIVKVGHYRERLQTLIDHPETMRGRSFGSAKVDERVGGLRAGVYVVTGDTSSGKTTFTTWVALHEATMGVPVLLTAFEQREELVAKLVRMQLRKDLLRATPQERERALAELDDLPLHIADHHGHITPAGLVELLRSARRVHGVKHAVVDHLGFVLDDDADDERKMIEATIRALVTVSKVDDMTIVLVAHPNRQHVAQRRRVGISDLKGASAIEQDCDVGIVVERLAPKGTGDTGRPRTRVHVDKCRSEFGFPGARCTLYFDRGSCLYADEAGLLDALVVGGGSGLYVEPERDAGPEGFA